MKVEKDTWFIAYTPDTDIVHFGFVSQGKQLDTGQPNLELFDDEESWTDRVHELGGKIYPSEEQEEEELL